MTFLFFKKHWLVVCAALIVGAIYVAPHLAFRFSPSVEYQGIPLLQTSNEDYYLTRIREVIDGHYSTGSFTFFEYKEKPPLTPPAIEFLYALPTLLFGIPYTFTAVASRFVLPAVLFLLVYALIFEMTKGGKGEHVDTKEKREKWARWNAIAGALVVTLGYDLVDYRGIFHLLTTGEPTTSSLLFWSRLIHPISGGVLLFAFLLLIWFLIRGTKYRKWAITGAGACLALMFASYFFSWGVAVSVLAAAALLYLFKKEYATVKNLIGCLGIGVLLSAPYWLVVWRTTQDPLYAESVMRGGLFYTHYPLFNKFVLAVLFLYIVLVWGVPAVKKIFSVENTTLPPSSPQLRGGGEKEWQFFVLALILGSLWVYIEQVVTGMTIWPYHFPQYTIPIGLVVLFVLFFNTVFVRFPRIWITFAAALAGLSLAYGIFIQTYVYRGTFQDNVALEQAAPMLAFLDSRERPCVVLVSKPADSVRSWNYIVTAFTHCDIYAETGVNLLVPYERVLHNYLTDFRMQGLTPSLFGEFLRKNPDAPRGYLFGNWKGLFNVRDFPDFNDSVLEERMHTLPDDYRDFLKEDFREQLQKYRLDYILSVGQPLLPSVLAELPGTKLIQTFGEMYVYRLNP